MKIKSCIIKRKKINYKNIDIDLKLEGLLPIAKELGRLELK